RGGASGVGACTPSPPGHSGTPVCHAATKPRRDSGNRRGPRTPLMTAADTSRRQETTLVTSQPSGAVAASARNSSAVYRAVPPGIGASSCSAITVSSRDLDTTSILRRVPTDLAATTIVVVTWRGRNHVGACLDALQAQHRDHRVLVVDNASDDGTAAVLAAHPSSPTVVRLARNVGYAGGIAAALARVRTPLMAWLNDDARPAPGWLAALEDTLTADAAAVAAQVRRVEGAEIGRASSKK